MKPSTSLFISIPEPCSQPWEGMAITDNARFCDHCSKTVVDFTGMSDAALVEYLKKNGTGCGRFLSTQLNREIIQKPTITKKLWHSLLLGIGLLFSMLKGAVAQDRNANDRRIETEVQVIAPSTSDNEKEGGSNATTIEGTITDKKGNPVPGVQVLVSNLSRTFFTSAVTDLGGVYRLVLTEDQVGLQQMVLMNISWPRFGKEECIKLSARRNVVNYCINTTLRYAREKEIVIVVGRIQSGIPPLINPKEPTRCTIVMNR